MLNLSSMERFFGVPMPIDGPWVVQTPQSIVRIEPNRLTVLLSERNIDLTKWYEANLYGGIFLSQSGYGGVVLWFNHEIDETEQALLTYQDLMTMIQP